MREPLSDQCILMNRNRQDKNGNTLLHLAAKSNNSRVVQRLLKHGYNAELINKAGRTALHEAIIGRASNEVIKQLITPNTINMTDSDGHTALTLAESLRAHRIVRELLRRGAGVTQQSGCEDALHLACAVDDNVAVIQQLIRAGADWKKKVGCRRMNALATAVYYNANINARYLMNEMVGEFWDLYEEDGDGNFLFHTAAQSGNVDMLRYCIDSEMLVGVRNHHGEHILHLVCNGDNIECLKLLLEWEGGKEMFRQLPRNKKGETPLHYLAVRSHYEMMQLFLSADPPLDDQDNNGGTALTLAVGLKDLRVVELLLEKGADPSIPDKNELLSAHFQ